MIASAGMYEWTDSLATAWGRMLEWVRARAGADLVLVENRAMVSLDALWARADLGCALMCGYPWALRGGDPGAPELLAAPVPSPSRYGGRAVYVTDFVARADSPHRTLEDTFGGRLAYSTERSHSGYNAARHHLLRYRSPARPALFAAVRGPYERQRRVIQAVLEGEADVGPVDGYALDLLRRHDPSTVARLRVVATTAPAPTPAFVASPSIDPVIRRRVLDALLSVHEAPDLRTTCEDLLLLRFVPADPGRYRTLFLDWERAAQEAHYARLA